jgi:hypothetical protein
MWRSSIIRFLSAVIGETSVTDDNITKRLQCGSSGGSFAAPPRHGRRNKSEDEKLLKLLLAA